MQAGVRESGTFHVAESTSSNTAPVGAFGTGAIAYKLNDFGFSWNGADALTDTSTTLPVVQQLYIGNNGGLAGNFLNGHIARLTYYPKRLPNATLQALSK
jgi:hypothetical protein